MSSKNKWEMQVSHTIWFFTIEEEQKFAEEVKNEIG